MELDKVTLETLESLTPEQLNELGPEVWTYINDLYGNKALWPAPYNEDTPESAYRFLTECCWTFDEETTEVNLIPALPFVRLVVNQFYETRKSGKPLKIEKSRRLLLSWIVRGLRLHSMGLRRESGVICGLNYPKAASHVWRIAWLYNTLASKRKDFKLTPLSTGKGYKGGTMESKKMEEVILPNGSIVVFLNQEGESFQGDGYTWVDMEESSLYSKYDEMRGQSLAVTKGRADVVGGHVCEITNASPGEEWKSSKTIATVLWNNDPSFEKGEPNPDECPGCALADLVSGARYLRIHYTADPSKRSPEYKEQGRRERGVKWWDQQMEMSEDIYTGEPVFPEFVYAQHAPVIYRESSVEIVPGSRFFAGWDCGLTLQPSFELAMVTPCGQVYWMMEIVPDGACSMSMFAPIVAQKLKQRLPANWSQVDHYGDPAGKARAGTDMRSAYDVALKCGILIKPALSQNPIDRQNAVIHLLNDWISQEDPNPNKWVQRTIYSEKDCPVLVDGMKGAYCMTVQKNTSGRNLVLRHPSKNYYSHSNDAHQYAAMSIVRHIIKGEANQTIKYCGE